MNVNRGTNSKNNMHTYQNNEVNDIKIQKGEYSQKHMLTLHKTNMIKSQSNNSNSIRKREDGATSSAAMLSSETTDLKLPSN